MQQPVLLTKWNNYINAKTISILYIVVAVFTAFHKYFTNHYNNYLVYTKALQNMLAGKTMYIYYPEMYHDMYRYSPTFAVIMGWIGYLPALLGITIWNILNTVVLVSAINRLFEKESWKITACLLVIFIEWLTATQNLQSNALIAGLMLWGYIHLKNEKPVLAAFVLSLTLFIKFYGILAAIMFLFFPKKRQFIISGIVSTMLILILPLIVISPSELIMQYQEWFRDMSECKLPHSISIMATVEAICGFTFNYKPIQIIAAIVTLLPLIRLKSYANEQFQILILASLMLFVIVFNHMAESPTYVIAVTGVTLWFFHIKELETIDKVLLILVILFTCLAPTDLYPKFIRTHIFVPYAVKAIPCALVWVRIQQQLWKKN